MKARVLLDTGPLVALLNRADRHHAWTRDQFSMLDEAPITVEPVLAEACHLLIRSRANPGAVLRLVERGAIRLGLHLSEEMAAVRDLFEKYDTAPASLADACLVRLSELHEPSVVMTFDSDFLVYRRHGRRVIGVLSPPG